MSEIIEYECRVWNRWDWTGFEINKKNSSLFFLIFFTSFLCYIFLDFLKFFQLKNTPKMYGSKLVNKLIRSNSQRSQQVLWLTESRVGWADLKFGFGRRADLFHCEMVSFGVAIKGNFFSYSFFSPFSLCCSSTASTGSRFFHISMMDRLVGRRLRPTSRHSRWSKTGFFFKNLLKSPKMIPYSSWVWIWGLFPQKILRSL